MMSGAYKVDPLSDVISLLQPRTYVSGAISAGDPWSLQLPEFQGIKCDAVVEGECWLAVAGEEPARLCAGDCLLLPHGRPFVIASDLHLPPVDARTVVASVARYNGVLLVTPGEGVLILGSHFDFEGDASFLLDALPAVVHVTGAKQSEAMRWSMQRILEEMRDPQPGGTLIAQQVAHTLLIDALRLFQGNRESGPGWLSALADLHTRAALTCMHERPAHAWTLEELARAAGLSRTAFALRFRQQVGETPIAYLTRWRMNLAAKRLAERKETLPSTAMAVGYRSTSAFCAAFKQHRGVSPKRYVSAQKMGVSARGVDR